MPQTLCQKCLLLNATDELLLLTALKMDYYGTFFYIKKKELLCPILLKKGDQMK